MPSGTDVGGVGALRGGAAFASSGVGGVFGIFAGGGLEGLADETGVVSFGAGGTSPVCWLSEIQEGWSHLPSYRRRRTSKFIISITFAHPLRPSPSIDALSRIRSFKVILPW